MKERRRKLTGVRGEQNHNHPRNKDKDDVIMDSRKKKERKTIYLAFLFHRVFFLNFFN